MRVSNRVWLAWSLLVLSGAGCDGTAPVRQRSGSTSTSAETPAVSGDSSTTTQPPKVSLGDSTPSTDDSPRPNEKLTPDSEPKPGSGQGSGTKDPAPISSDTTTPVKNTPATPATTPTPENTARPAASANMAAKFPAADGWLNLFDGETFFGWKSNNDDLKWTITNGVVHAEEGPSGLLVTTTEFTDYELSCDFRLVKGGNSGLFLRTLVNPKVVTADCYELNICDSRDKFGTASLVGIVDPPAKVEAEGDWHTYRVQHVGNKLEVWLDEKLVLSYVDERPEARGRGHFGLQKNSGKAEYRNVYLRPLMTKPIFNGKDLAGWRVVPGGKSEFTVDDGEIRVKDGRGFLETEETFGDFVLRAEAKTNGKALNSGIFFRAQPGTEKAPSNGYECQIHNAYKNDDRTMPADFGTGAIYRRIAARRVVSNDFEWTQLTVIAHGDHFGIWVNGQMVTDWTDTRAENDNPREGLRKAPGHFSLQGHDPTTDLAFRNLAAAKFPEK